MMNTPDDRNLIDPPEIQFEECECGNELPQDEFFTCVFCGNGEICEECGYEFDPEKKDGVCADCMIEQLDKLNVITPDKLEIKKLNGQLNGVVGVINGLREMLPIIADNASSACMDVLFPKKP